MNNDELCKSLSKIVSPENEDNWWKPKLFEKNTQPILPSELEILKIPPPASQQYNCFIHALGLSSDKRFLGEENGWPFDSYMMKDLVRRRLLKPIDSPEKNAIAFYEDDKMITHAALLESPEIAVSKWSWGPLLRHKIWDVPAHYGNKISFYSFEKSSMPEVARIAIERRNQRKKLLE